MKYEIELKQIVSYPRCRIYREFIRTLMDDRSIRLGGCSFFCFYTLLCSYANYQSHSVSYDGIKYHCPPGEWVCKLSEMVHWFRMRSGCYVLRALDVLQANGFLTYSRPGHGKLVKFKITDWSKSNRIIDDYAPCQKDSGFFFLPVHKAHELVSISKCSEMDVLLDLWVHAVYNDPQVDGSDLGPVIYYRDHSGNPLLSYSTLAERWGKSKSSVCRMLNSLEKSGYLKLLTFPGRHGTVVYLRQYLSTMFGISDVMIDKEELACTLSITVECKGEISAPDGQPEMENINVPDNCGIVPKMHLGQITQKVENILKLQGFSCAGCPKSSYILSSLSACKGRYELRVQCKAGGPGELFEVMIKRCPPPLGILSKCDISEMDSGEVAK